MSELQFPDLHWKQDVKSQDILSSIFFSALYSQNNSQSFIVVRTRKGSGGITLEHQYSNKRQNYRTGLA